MELFNNIPANLVNSIDSICISLLLGVLGIAITIFTVVYSFMESNKQTIRRITDEIKNSETKDPIRISDLQFANDYMSRMKCMNFALIVIIIYDILLFAFFCVYLAITTTTLRIIAYSLTIILIVACLVTLYYYLSQYLKKYKNV